MKSPAQLRDSGKSWSKIAKMHGITVARAKAIAEDEKVSRRNAVSHTESNERARGMLDICTCHHVRKSHENGICVDCEAKENWMVGPHEFRLDEGYAHGINESGKHYPYRNAEWFEDHGFPVGKHRRGSGSYKKSRRNAPQTDSASVRNWKRRERRNNGVKFR